MRHPHTRLKSPILGLALACALGTSFFPACSNSGGDDGNGGEGGEGGEGAEGGGKGGKGGNKGGSGGNNGGSGGNVGGEGGTAPQPEGACGPLAPAPIRRLATTEFNGTVRELFQKLFPPYADKVWRLDSHFLKYTRPGSAEVQYNRHLGSVLVKDPTTFGFQNRASNLNATGLHVETFDDVAFAIAEALVVGRELRPANSTAPLKPLDALEKPCAETTLSCAQKVVEQYAPRIYRRPLTDEEKTELSAFVKEEFDAATAKGGGVDAFAASLQLTFEALLQSAPFLYRVEIGEPTNDGAAKLTAYETASRLSYLLWSTMPDSTLLEAASKNELSTPEQREQQAQRMLKDPRFRYMVVEFFRQWADFERIFAEGYRRKNGRSLGDPTHALGIFYTLGAREEIARFVEWVFADSDGSLNTLFTSTKAWGNSQVEALFAGALLPDARDYETAPWKELTLNPAERAGILTRPLIPWVYSHFDTPNPPARGGFIMSKVLCRSLGTPPADAMTLAGTVTFAPGTSNRQQFDARIRPKVTDPATGETKEVTTCVACHRVMDPLGFAMEKYSEIGMFLKADLKNGKTIDASGNLMFGTDIDGPFTDLVDLSKKFGDSETVRQCLTTQFYEYAVGRTAAGSIALDEEGVDKCRLSALDTAVKAKNGDLREALLQYVKSVDFVTRPKY